jgi:hypothetical protein
MRILSPWDYLTTSRHVPNQMPLRLLRRAPVVAVPPELLLNSDIGAVSFSPRGRMDPSLKKIFRKILKIAELLRMEW